jgi:AcrR family transcriptional regulator
MSSDRALRVEQTCRDLAAAGTPITFDDVAARAGTGRATLYRRPELRALIEEHRQTAREALTLTGLAVQIDQLRATLKALADKVRRQEERLRHLERRH